VGGLWGWGGGEVFDEISQSNQIRMKISVARNNGPSAGVRDTIGCIHPFVVCWVPGVVEGIFVCPVCTQETVTEVPQNAPIP